MIHDRRRRIGIALGDRRNEETVGQSGGDRCADTEVKLTKPGRGIGRSTFYEHFESKEEIFRDSLATPVEVLAASTCEPGGLDALERILAHFLAQRRLADAMLLGSARRVMSAVLSEYVAPHLAAKLSRERRQLAIPCELVADHLADAQLGLIGAWMAHGTPCDAAELARAPIDSTEGSVAALLR